ncbi:MAG TPA: S41 family peptidase [Gemmataceae bacterium]|nr:S41 family peptidase [Gemmataceae bacterium]
MIRRMLSAVVLVLGCGAAPAAAAEARLLRFPAIHGDRVCFTYAGNLYLVPAAGGVARRVTNHDGFEMFPRFSPDGKWLAFTGQYDGNTEVYLMPAEGGPPRRLTWTATLGRDDVSDRMGPNNIVMDWKHDSKTIVFRSRFQSHNDFIGQLFTISIDGGLPQELPLPRGGFCSYSPDDSKLVYNRVFREFRTWKRYRGGMADDLWLYDFATKKTEQLTNTPDQEIIPMWHGDKIYFAADRDDARRMNLHVLDLKSHETKQLTHHADYDIKFPSLGDRAIVYECGGWVFRFDLATEKSEKIAIQIDDDVQTGRGGLKDVSHSVADYGIAPDGKRALFSARGDIFTVPAQHGPTRNLTDSPGSHDRDPDWAPDGKSIAYVSDSSGEDEIWVAPQDGKGSAKQVTTGGDCYKYSPVWSPDSKKLLWSDRKQRLQFIDVDKKQVKLVFQSPVFEIRDYVWSPDGKWVAYARPEAEGETRIYLYSVDQDKTYPVTDGWYASSLPCFSADGKYLFFVSNRDFNPTYSRTEWNHAYVDMQRVYLVPLAKDTASPFKPKDDEVNAPEPPAPPAADKNAPIKVDPDGLPARVVGLPIQPATYSQLRSAGSTVYYIRRSAKDPAQTLQMYDLTAQKETGLGAVAGYDLSANRKKMIVAQGGGETKYGIIDLPKGPVEIKEPLNLRDLDVRLDRHAEWRQIFNECWRQMRDYFYDPNMHGVDWRAMREKYAPLVEHVNHRADLTYVIGEMIGELNIGHAYVGGGDVPEVKKIPLGLLGAKLVQDPATKAIKIVRILPGDNWDKDKNLHSPLTEAGVDAHEGDYIIAIDGRPVTSLTTPFEALVNKAGKQVTLTLNKDPKPEGAREVTVVPIGDEAKLYYRDWVRTNLKKVEDATGGKVGYVHVPDMQTTGLNEFVRQFGPQLRKKALIMDVRGNGGGNVSPMLIERLRRDLVMVDIARNGIPTPDPADQLVGPKVCLMNEFSASDGDLFPYRFRAEKLGKLIGKRSWGGVVGIRNSLPLVDGGTLNRPEFSRYDVTGKEWIIEGHGVDPDIVVDNDPAKEYAGEDQQLQKAIEVILEELKTSEKTLPPVPPFPKKAPG